MLGALERDIAGQFIMKSAFAETDLTAASTGDNTEVVGTTIDLQALVTRAECVCLAVWCRTANTAAKVLNVTNTFQYAPDNGSGSAGSWVDITKANGCGQDALAVAIGTISGTGTQLGVLKHNLDLTRIPTTARFIRTKPTPDLTASGTDTATIVGILIFGGLQQTPQS